MNILYEDNHLIIINKAAGELVQGDKTGDQPLLNTLKLYIKEKFDKPGEVYLGAPHRIDRPTTGLVVFTRTSKAHTRMCQLFHDKKTQKTYWAIVQRKPEPAQGTLHHFLVKSEGNNKSFVSQQANKQAKEAILHYQVKKSSDNYHLLEIRLETGRHHQIRCQLAQIGCPVKGDLKYGAPRSNADKGISLHARSIKFIHPVKKEPVHVVAPPPDDTLWNYFISQES